MAEFWNNMVAKGPFYLAGQAIGLVAIALAFAIYTQKDRDKLVIMKLVADALNVLQNAFSGTYAGAATSVVMCLRDFVFIYRGKKKWAEHIVWLFVFEIFIFVSPFITTKEVPFSFLWYINILPALGSGVATVGLYNKKAVIARLLSMIGIILILIYVIVLQNYIQIVSNTISIVASVIGLLGDYGRKKKAMVAGNEELKKE